VNAVRGPLPRRRVGTRRRSANQAPALNVAAPVTPRRRSRGVLTRRRPLRCQLHNLAVHENTHSDQATLNEQQHVRVQRAKLARCPLAHKP
jgi:hypothetical protein